MYNLYIKKTNISNTYVNSEIFASDSGHFVTFRY